MESWAGRSTPPSRVDIVKIKPDDYLQLGPLPGTAALVAGPQEQLTRPTAVAIDRHGRMLVTDAATHQIKLLDAAGVKVLPGIGGVGAAPRNLRAPYGIVALATGEIIVSDTGNHRVQMFSAAPYALLQVWEQGFDRPWGLAIDAACALHIVDRGNHRVVRTTTRGTVLTEYGGNVLTDPTQIACGLNGAVAVVDGATVVIFPSGRKIDAVTEPRAVAFDSDGLLYIGDAQGLIYKFAPDTKVAGRYNLVWYGAAGLEDEATILHMIWDAKLGLVMLFKEPGDPVRRRLWTVDTAGSHVTQGMFVTQALDSELEKCSWHRIQLTATVPVGTSVEVETFTAETGTPDLEYRGVQTMPAGGLRRSRRPGAKRPGTAAVDARHAALRRQPDARDPFDSSLFPARQLSEVSTGGLPGRCGQPAFPGALSFDLPDIQ